METLDPFSTPATKGFRSEALPFTFKSLCKSSNVSSAIYYTPSSVGSASTTSSGDSEGPMWEGNSCSLQVLPDMDDSADLTRRYTYRNRVKAAPVSRFFGSKKFGIVTFEDMGDIVNCACSCKKECFRNMNRVSIREVLWKTRYEI